MSRARAARAALLAYPADVRERLGAEMIGTVLDVSRGSRRRFARELAGLVRAGLRARTAPRRALADGVCLAAAWLMTLDLSTLLAQIVRGMHDPLLAPASLALLGVALALALVGYDRPAGAAALAWTAARLPALLDHFPGRAPAGLGVSLIPAACFATLLLAPRRRAPDPRRLGWLAVPVVLAATFGPAHYDQSPLLVALVAVAAVLVALYALATLPTDPRVAIAAAVPLATLGAAPGRIAVGLVFVAPLVLAVGAARLRRRPGDAR